MAPALETLKRVSRENLATALRLLRGKKTLVVESTLVSTLDLIANFSFLKDHGVEKILHLDKCTIDHTKAPNASKQWLYMIRSDLISAKLVCDQINNAISHGLDLTFGVVVIPRLIYVITCLFESEGLYEYVKFGQYSHELIPLDDHILSLQMTNVLPDLWLHKDTTCLAAVAKVLFNLRGIYGDFHHVIAMGKYSQSVLRMTYELEKKYSDDLKAHNRVGADIPTLIVMDRSLDFVSPLLSPLTYEALLDELIGIKGKSVTFGSDITGKEPVKHILSNDPVFDKTRSLHFSQVVKNLLAQKDDIRRAQDETPGLNLRDMKKLVQKDLSRLQLLRKTLVLHVGAVDSIIKEKSEEIKNLVDIEQHILENTGHKEVFDFLEDCMTKGTNNMGNVLRLFCLMSLCQDGMRDAKTLRTQFVQSYGFKHMITLHNLEKMSMLHDYKGIEVHAKGLVDIISRRGNSASSPGSSSTSKKPAVAFQSIVKKLVPPTNVEVDCVTQNHPSYVFSGKYTPFVAKLTEDIISTLDSKLSATVIEKKLDDLMKFFCINDNEVCIKSDHSVDAYSRGRNVFVFVLGGITRAEIAALQTVGKNTGFNILCSGTDITNGFKVVNSSVDC